MCSKRRSFETRADAETWMRDKSVSEQANRSDTGTRIPMSPMPTVVSHFETER